MQSSFSTLVTFQDWEPKQGQFHLPVSYSYYDSLRGEQRKTIQRNPEKRTLFYETEQVNFDKFCLQIFTVNVNAAIFCHCYV